VLALVLPVLVPLVLAILALVERSNPRRKGELLPIKPPIEQIEAFYSFSLCFLPFWLNFFG